MIPAKITIEGNYWDVQIYRGRLYLFTINGAIRTIDWNKLMSSIRVEQYIKIALTYAFQNGRNLYHSELHELFKDTDVKNLLENKFTELSNQHINIAEASLLDCLIGEQETPFNELHTDSEVFSNRLYILNHNSLQSSPIHGKSKRYPVGKSPEKHFDLYGFAIRANKFARMIVSAGDDGLMEYNGSSNISLSPFDDRRMDLISPRHSTFADYSFLSVYNSSLSGDSFMSYFKWKDDRLQDQPERIKIDEFEEKEIFSTEQPLNSYLSWGSHEKIYRAVEGGLEMVRFNNYAKPGEQVFSERKFIPLQPWKGKILSAYVAYFGTVLQCENAVVVMLSDETYYNIAGEVSRVRIFPRSLNYENHLHVIHDDRLEVYSFNNDYFVDQKTKDFGFAYKTPKTYGFVRGGYASRYESDEDFYDLDILKKIQDNKNDEASEKELPF